MLSDQLLNEITRGEGEPLSAAARRLPPTRRGRPVTLGCVLRWVLSGVRLSNGTTVCLEAARCGGRWLTTPPALQRFLAAQTPTADSAKGSRTATARTRAAQKAAAELERLGV